MLATVVAANLLDFDQRRLQPLRGLAADPQALAQALLEHFRARPQRCHFDLTQPLADLDSAVPLPHCASSLAQVMAHELHLAGQSFSFASTIDALYLRLRWRDHQGDELTLQFADA